jgi:hypothetical protein
MTASDTLTALADAGKAADVIVHKMIIDELTPILDGLSVREEEAAGLLRDAVGSMRQPAKHLNELESELEQVQQKYDDFRSRIGNPLLPAEDRVMARGMAGFYDEEATALRARVDQAKAEAELAQGEVNKARNRLASVHAAQEAVCGAMLAPWQHPLAQQTKAFTFYITSHLCEILLLSDESDMRWDAALDQLKLLAQVFGYRTDALTQAEADQRKRDYQAYREMHTPEITPSAMDVIRAQEQVVTRTAEDSKHRDVIDDRRGMKLPPRNQTVPDYMRTERLSDMLPRRLQTSPRLACYPHGSPRRGDQTPLV